MSGWGYTFRRPSHYTRRREPIAVGPSSAPDTTIEIQNILAGRNRRPRVSDAIRPPARAMLALALYAAPAPPAQNAAEVLAANARPETPAIRLRPTYTPTYELSFRGLVDEQAAVSDPYTVVHASRARRPDGYPFSYRPRAPGIPIAERTPPAAPADPYTVVHSSRRRRPDGYPFSYRERATGAPESLRTPPAPPSDPITAAHLARRTRPPELVLSAPARRSATAVGPTSRPDTTIEIQNILRGRARPPVPDGRSEPQKRGMVPLALAVPPAPPSDPAEPAVFRRRRPPRSSDALEARPVGRPVTIIIEQDILVPHIRRPETPGLRDRAVWVPPRRLLNLSLAVPPPLPSDPIVPAVHGLRPRRPDGLQGEFRTRLPGVPLELRTPAAPAPDPWTIVHAERRRRPDGYPVGSVTSRSPAPTIASTLPSDPWSPVHTLRPRRPDGMPAGIVRPRAPGPPLELVVPPVVSRVYLEFALRPPVPAYAFGLEDVVPSYAFGLRPPINRFSRSNE